MVCWIYSVLCCFCLTPSQVAAEEDRRVSNGVWIGITEEQPIIDLAGMTLEEIESTMNDYMEALSNLEVKLIVSGGQEVVVTMDPDTPLTEEMVLWVTAEKKNIEKLM